MPDNARNIMKTIATIYVMLTAFNLMAVPFLFGEERKPYNPKTWLLNLVAAAPLFWLLLKIIFN